MKSKGDRISRQSGATLIEFVMVAPFFLMLMFGMAEMGFAFFDKAVITNAAREGARAAIVLDAAKTASTATGLVNSVVNNYCANNLISLGGTSSCVVNVNQSDPPTFGTPLEVTVSYTYQGLWLVSLLGLTGNSIEMSSRVTMFNE